ncbi:hypothetical protein HYDPIDRAFT_85265 [Hydnomerulius pinastri MD-312]|nr:hypothetical protein HYDPIDRAFT_85265 [Hydnomerulius pinastri MD-312]
MALYKPYSSRTLAKAEQPAITEFDILKASHKFLRDSTEAETSTSWNDQLAKKYYDSLYREFAVCDLKHYKSGNFALRWRTETEVLDGTGETSCANTRCEHHHLSSAAPELSTLELPFAYEEHSQRKEALVKVVLCPRCVRKLMWKRRHGKREAEERGRDKEEREDAEKRTDREGDILVVEELTRRTSTERREEDPTDAVAPRERRCRTSRSRSPRPPMCRQGASSELATRCTQRRRQTDSI